jgi:phosphoglucomutase
MIATIQTKPFEGQKPGTSGLLKVPVFQQAHYAEISFNPFRWA